ncbi:hypothetical protein WG31_02940 [Acetobacter oryzifermentans]|uniref:Uncharacterized protein n=1 Tax=Acetobacter oryzifermentans TaxID=1633874 RepID=A0ABM6AHE4_9PROT|nr:hypothetical protein WG31_02940 [Acetobacter oryzifermentans]
MIRGRAANRLRGLFLCPDESETCLSDLQFSGRTGTSQKRNAGRSSISSAAHRASAVTMPHGKRFALNTWPCIQSAVCLDAERRVTD